MTVTQLLQKTVLFLLGHFIVELQVNHHWNTLFHLLHVILLSLSHQRILLLQFFNLFYLIRILFLLFLFLLCCFKFFLLFLQFLLLPFLMPLHQLLPLPLLLLYQLLHLTLGHPFRLIRVNLFLSLLFIHLDPINKILLFVCFHTIKEIQISPIEVTLRFSRLIIYGITSAQIIFKMSNAFKKKKQETADELSNQLNFLLGSQILQSNSQNPIQLQRALIIKSAMFWDSKNRIERIKSLVLSNINLQEFDNVDDFKIAELTSIKQLSLSKNKIIHLQPLSILDTLITLNINHNKVYNLAPLQELQSLQELYASNNQISNLEPLKKLGNLRILNVYNNKIVHFEGTFSALQQLKQLEDLDIEENPFYSQSLKDEFMSLPITRFNDELISKSQKDSQMSKSIVNMSSSCVINPLNVSMLRDTKTSFFNPSNKSIKRNKIKQMTAKLQQLQDQYSKVDDEFEEQIVKNVQLKSEFLRYTLQIKKAEGQREDNEYKAQQIKLLKRKAKDLKQNLFTKDKKGELLRRLFELQTQGVVKKVEKKQTKKAVVWTRRFDSDDVIIIEDDNKYLEEDAQMAQLLQSNSSALQQLRKQLKSLY